MKILCVDASTLDGSIEDGAVRVLPETAIVREGSPVFLPDMGISWQFRFATGVKVTRLGKAINEKFASRYYSAFLLAAYALPLDCKNLFHFPYSGLDGSIILAEPVGEHTDINVSLENLRRRDTPPEELAKTILHLPDLSNIIAQGISHASRYFTVHTGDIVIITGLLSNSLPVEINTRLVIKGVMEKPVAHKIK